MIFVAPALLVMALVVTMHGVARALAGPRADRLYSEAASVGSIVSFRYIIQDSLPVWQSIFFLTAVGIATYYLSVKAHQKLSAPTVNR